VNIDKLKVFGCKAYYYIDPNLKENKFHSNSKPGIFLGYDINANGYIIMDYETLKTHVVRDAVFEEEIPGNFNLINKKPYHEEYNLPSLHTDDDIDDYEDINIEDKETFDDNPKSRIFINPMLSTQQTYTHINNNEDHNINNKKRKLEKAKNNDKNMSNTNTTVENMNNTNNKLNNIDNIMNNTNNTFNNKHDTSNNTNNTKKYTKNDIDDKNNRKVLFENNNNFIKDLNIDEDKQKYENTMIDTYNEDKIINSNNSNQEYMKNNRMKITI